MIPASWHSGQKEKKSVAVLKAAARAMQSDPFDKTAMADLNKMAADKETGAKIRYKFEKEKRRNPIDGKFGIVVTTYEKVLEMPSINSEEFKNSNEYKDAVAQGKTKKKEDGKEVERSDRDKQTLIEGAYNRFSKDESNRRYVDKKQDEERFDETRQLMQFLGSKNEFVDYETAFKIIPNYESDLKRYMSEYYYKTVNAGGSPITFEEWRSGTTQGTTEETTTENNIEVTSGSPIN